MKNYLGSLGTVLGTGFATAALVLGLSAGAAAQYAPPASQQPMEIPAQAQYPPPPQGGPQPQAAPQNDPGAARISFMHGDVSTQHSGSSEWAAATINTPVVNGDHISTGQNARAEIQLDHANVLRLSDQTTANVVSLARNQMQLQIGQGLANYEVFKNNDANVEIDTLNVAIRPETGEGSYRILVNSDGETIVDVRKGSAEISTPQGSTRVERDQRITIQGSADSAQYQVSGAPGRDDWDKWNGDRDRVIEGAQSWQHTNPYYTGSQDLDTYGHWSNVPDYGDVWFPSAGADWAPYRDGRWVFEPYYGWTWVSYEPWGWAPYHYGRWFVYGGNWGWWPGPVYVGYRPLWAPAYVSFFGFGGGGWGVNVGFGFGGGFGSIGWLPCGPGDRFFPWYGRGVNRVNVVNVTNIHNNFGGIGPLRDGPHAFSNIDRAGSDVRVRGGFSSMQSNEFGHGRVPAQQVRIDSGTFRQASVMTGAHPMSPSRESFQSTNRPVSPNSIPNRATSNQRFFSSNARTSGAFQSGRGDNNFNRGGNPGGNVSRGTSSEQGQRGFNGPASQPGHSIQSSRPGWRTFSPPSGQQGPSNGGRSYENSGRSYQDQGREQGRGPGQGQVAPQPRPNYSQPSEQPRQYQNYSRGGYNGGNYSRPTLNMQQPVVTPRGGGSNGSYAGGSRTPTNGNYGGYRGAPPSGGSYSGRPAPSAPSGGGSGGGYRGSPSGGGSHGGNSGGSHGGSSGGGHSHH
ncbi:MAG TPA: DUF6600 domain-containing protein [Bryobacteraceae bacterium]|nr:DUF6600 domain-containing protein [Bryobacteraceae bacterium]